MKLFLGLAFVLLLTFLRRVSTQTEAPSLAGHTIPGEWKRSSDETQTSTTNLMYLSESSGNGVPESANQTTSVATKKLVTSQEPDKVNFTSDTTTLMPNMLLKDSNNTTLQSNESFIPNENASSPLTTSASPVTTITPQNQTTVSSTTPEASTINSTTTTAAENFTTTFSPTVENSTSAKNVTNTTSATATTTISTSSNVTNTTSPTTTSPVTSTDLLTPEVPDLTTTTTNITDFRENSDREKDAGSFVDKQVRGQAWGVLLGVTIAVGIVILAVYVIKKRRGYRDFSHRKLVEDVPHNPVLRLDNVEPLDLKLDGSAYYNPGLQDSIQMTNFPQGQFSC